MADASLSMVQYFCLRSHRKGRKAREEDREVVDVPFIMEPMSSGLLAVYILHGLGANGRIVVRGNLRFSGVALRLRAFVLQAYDWLGLFCISAHMQRRYDGGRPCSSVHWNAGFNSVHTLAGGKKMNLRTISNNLKKHKVRATLASQVWTKCLSEVCIEGFVDF